MKCSSVANSGAVFDCLLSLSNNDKTLINTFSVI